jgi:PPOX class probable F420-dependent enzyme
VPSGRADSIDELPARVRELIGKARRGVMTTVARDGSPHAVPVVFACNGDEIISPIDHKPKLGVKLLRVKNLERDDRVTLLLDLWDEDWTQLVWLMIRGRATIDAEPAPDLTNLLVSRYPQYEDEVMGGNAAVDALIRIRPTLLSWWSWA